MEKRLVLASILIAMFMISGCAVSDYITGTNIESQTDDQTYSLLPDGELTDETDDTEDSTEELEGIMEEIDSLAEEAEDDKNEEESTADSEETDVNEKDTTEKTEESEETEKEEDEKQAEEESEKADTPIKISVKEDETVNLKPKAKDADNDMITYSFSEPLDNNGKWKTTYGDAGEYLITVTASDGELETTKKVLLVVERVNVAPEITGVSDKITIDEGEVLSLDPKVNDPNGDDVEVTISEPVGNDGEWVIEYQDAGEYEVEITATDGEMETVKEIQIIVNKKNVAPTISNIESSIEIEEGDIISLSPKVEDLNGDDVEVTISEPVGDSGIWETSYNDHGVYTVTIKATDSLATTTKEIEIVVKDVNTAPVIEDITQG